MNRRQRYRRQAAEAARSPQAAEFPALPTALQATPTPAGPGGDRPATAAADPAATGDRQATAPQRRRRRWSAPPADRPRSASGPDQATASPPAAPGEPPASTPAAASPAGQPAPATAAAAGQPAPDAMGDREQAVAADYAALLAHRRAGGWSDLERRQLLALAGRMFELRAINLQLEAEGLTVPGRAGRPAAHPLLSVRKATELAIKRERTALGLNVSIGEARRQGRALAADGDEFGIAPDGGFTQLLAFALDPDALLARPEGHDYEPEELLHHRLIEAGQADARGGLTPGGRLWAIAVARCPQWSNPEPFVIE
jgi:hypothetical protein